MNDYKFFIEIQHCAKLKLKSKSSAGVRRATVFIKRGFWNKKKGAESAPVGIKNSWKYEKDLIIFNLNGAKPAIARLCNLKIPCD